MKKIYVCCFVLLFLIFACGQEKEDSSALGKIGTLSVKRNIDTQRTYGLKITAEAVLGATHYYLYHGTSGNPDEANILIDNITNDLSISLDRYTTKGTYYFWYKATDGKHFTKFSNRCSITFEYDKAIRE